MSRARGMWVEIPPNVDVDICMAVWRAYADGPQGYGVAPEIDSTLNPRGRPQDRAVRILYRTDTPGPALPMEVLRLIFELAAHPDRFASLLGHDAVRRLLESDSPDVREWAMRAAGHLPRPSRALRPKGPSRGP